MSRQNKVNPARYTQRGRLTQDDAARELRKQSLIGSPHTWQPVNTRRRPPLAPAGDANRQTEASADNEPAVAASPKVKTRPNATATAVKAKGVKAKTATTRKSKRTAVTAKTATAAKARKPAVTPKKRTMARLPAKAARPRNAGRGATTAPRRTTKRRSS